MAINMTNELGPVRGSLVKKKRLRSQRNDYYSWERAMQNAHIPFSGGLSLNTIRINMSAFHSHFKSFFFDRDLSLPLSVEFYYEAACKCLNSISPERYSTRHNVLHAITNFAKYLCSRNILGNEILQKLKEIRFRRGSEPRKHNITEQQMEDLIRKIQEDQSRSIKQRNLDITLFTLYFYTGFRAGEAIALSIDNIDLKAREMRIYKTKNRKNHIVGINDKLLPVLTDYINNYRPKSQSTNLFLLPDGTPITLDRLQKRTAKVLEKCNLPKGLHQFRRGFATHFANRNIPIHQLQIALNHQNIETTRNYIMTSKQEVAQYMVNW